MHNHVARDASPACMTANVLADFFVKLAHHVIERVYFIEVGQMSGVGDDHQSAVGGTDEPGYGGVLSAASGFFSAGGVALLSTE